MLQLWCSSDAATSVGVQRAAFALQKPSTRVMRDAIQGFAAVLVSHVASANGFQACTIVERGASGPGGSNKLDQQRFWLDIQNGARDLRAGAEARATEATRIP